jgi:hypothetical protein
MRKSELELRSPLWIALAFILGPVCGLMAWLAIGLAFDPDANLSLDPFLIVLVVGVPACLLVEVAVVIPILVGFRAFRWWWLNGWSAAAIGFLLAVGGWAVLTQALPPPDGDAPPPDAWQVMADVTLPGWMQVAAMHVAAAAWWGVIGLVAALVFRLVAVRPGLLPASLWRL